GAKKSRPACNSQRAARKRVCLTTRSPGRNPYPTTFSRSFTMTRLALTSLTLLLVAATSLDAVAGGADRLRSRGPRRPSSSQSSESGWSTALQQGMQQGIQQGIATRMSQPQGGFNSSSQFRQQTVVVTQGARQQAAEPTESVLVAAPQPTLAAPQAEMSVRKAPAPPAPVF